MKAIALLLYFAILLWTPYTQGAYYYAVAAAGGGGGTLAFVQGDNAAEMFNGDTSHTCAFTSGNTAGNLIHVVAWWSSATATCTITDSKGNTYAAHASSLVQDNLYSLQSFYAKNISAGANTVTMTISGAVDNKGLAVIEISGASTTSPVDVQKATTVGDVAGGTNTIDSGTFTTTANGCYIVAAMMSNSFSASTATAGTLSQAYTLLETQNGSGQMFYTEGALQTTGSASTKATFSPAGFVGHVMFSAAAYKP